MNKMHHTYFYIHIFFFGLDFWLLTLRVRNIQTPIRLRKQCAPGPSLVNTRTLLWYCEVASYFCVTYFHWDSRFCLQITKVNNSEQLGACFQNFKSRKIILSLEHLLCFLSFHRHKIVRRYDRNSNLLCLCFNQSLYISAIESTELCSDWLRDVPSYDGAMERNQMSYAKLFS